MGDAERIAGTAELLLGAARAAEIRVTGDNRVAECDLETLLGLGERTLRAMREEGRAPPGYRVGNRWSYRLLDVAAWIESQRREWH